MDGLLGVIIILAIIGFIFKPDNGKNSGKSKLKTYYCQNCAHEQRAEQRPIYCPVCNQNNSYAKR